MMNPFIHNFISLLRTKALLIGVFACVMQAVSTNASLSDGLSFHASFEPDSVVQAVGRNQLSSDNLSRVEGIRSVAVQTSPKGLGISAPGNFNYPIGSASFWIRMPDSVSESSPKESMEEINLLQTENFCLRYVPASGDLIFMTGTTIPDVGYQWDYQCSTRLREQFPPSRWRHIAITWDAGTGQKKLYLDGDEVAASNTKRIRRNSAGMDLLLSFGKGAELQFDEISLWNRVLSVEEIATLSKASEITNYDLVIDSLQSSSELDELVRAGLQITPINQIERTIIAPGESFVVDIPVTNLTNRPVTGTARLVLEDFFGKTVDVHTYALSIESNGTSSLQQAFSPSEQGIYRVAFSFFPEGTEMKNPIPEDTSFQDVASFVVWPLESRLSDDSWFGLHVNSWGGGHVIRQAARLGFRHNRGHNMLQATWWTRAQFDPGPFLWEEESSLDDNIEAGMQVLGQFMGTPWWAARDGELPRQPNTYPSGAVPQYDAFSTYVTETVRKYKDRVHVWEIGNEPDVSMFWRGTPTQFSEYVQLAAKAARAEDPNALIMGSGYSTNDNFIKEAAEAGALRPLDALSIHIYHSPNVPPEITLISMEKRLAFFRDLLARYTDKPDMPIYQSEGGSSSTTFLRGVRFDQWPPDHVLPPMNWRSAAIRQVQSDILLLGLGFASSYSYFWNPTTQYISLSEEDINNTPKPKAVARAALAAFLDQCQFHAHIRLNDDVRFWAAIFSDNESGATRAVVWTGDDARVSIGTEAFADNDVLPMVQNLMGAKLPIGENIEFSETPVYLSSPLSPDVFAERLKAAQQHVHAAAAPLPVEQQGNQGANIPHLPDYAAMNENPQGIFSIDLHQYTNMGLVDEAAGDSQGGWADEGPYNDGRDIPSGRISIYGVPFNIINPEDNDAKSIITLRGQNVTPTFPLRVDGIPINRSRVRALYFLHTTAWGVPGNVGHYVVHYADGSTLELPLDIGKNIANWWDGYVAGESSKPWAVPVNNTLDGKPSWRYLRVWEWENPKPDVPIQSVDFVSAGNRQTPILLGITGVSW